jgi:hypothetical protein
MRRGAAPHEHSLRAMWDRMLIVFSGQFIIPGIKQIPSWVHVVFNLAPLVLDRRSTRLPRFACYRLLVSAFRAGAAVRTRPLRACAGVPLRSARLCAEPSGATSVANGIARELLRVPPQVRHARRDGSQHLLTLIRPLGAYAALNSSRIRCLHTVTANSEHASVSAIVRLTAAPFVANSATRIGSSRRFTSPTKR